MNRNALSSLLTGIIVALAATFTAGASRAYAQNPNCCDYIVNTSLVPASCFPLAVTTTWGPGVHTEIVTTPGFQTFHNPFPCPPAPPFLGVTVTSANGCCLAWTTNFCNGCLTIDVVSC